MSRLATPEDRGAESVRLCIEVPRAWVRYLEVIGDPELVLLELAPTMPSRV